MSKGLLNMTGYTELIDEVTDTLEELEQKELEQIQHIINSIKKSRAGGLHYLGSLLGIDVTNVDRVSMDLGMQNANTYGGAQGGHFIQLRMLQSATKLFLS